MASFTLYEGKTFGGEATLADIAKAIDYAVEKERGLIKKYYDKTSGKSLYTLTLALLSAIATLNSDYNNLTGDAKSAALEKAKVKAKTVLYSLTINNDKENGLKKSQGMNQNSSQMLNEAYTNEEYQNHIELLLKTGLTGSDTLDKYCESMADSKNYINFEKTEKQDNYIKFLNYNKPTGNSIVNNTEANKKSLKDEIKKLITEGGIKQIIFTGAPGTGKTFLADKIAKEIIVEEEELEDEKKIPENRIKKVQFHPSYDYTDFVEGIRPVEKGGTIGFIKLDGQFKAFCRTVAEDNEHPENSSKNKKWFFLIDEINRADLSKVFGELMFCLEKDKRGRAIDSQYQNLMTYKKDGTPLEKDVFKNGFFIPENVIIIGTMNDIDRSVESMDFALRRRFEWKEFIVEKEMLEEAFGSFTENGETDTNITIRDNKEEFAGRIVNLNKCIETNGKAFGLNRQYDISQGQFANLPEEINTEEEKPKDDVDKILKYVWKYRIESLLREYLRGEDEDSIKIFIEQCYAALFSSLKPDRPDGDPSDDGNSEAV